MKFILAPDSFKGSLSAVQAANIMVKAVLEEIPGAEAIAIPMADGGEGTVEALVAARGGTQKPLEVTGPLGTAIQASYGVVGDTAIMEAASLFGLTQVPETQLNPLHTTSAALGEAIIAALDEGNTQFVIGLGGSATNDGGIGLLTALGAVFSNRSGERLQGFGRDLLELHTADFSGLDARLKHCDITVACDVTNPLLGSEGASIVYGPQKGASPELCQQLDAAMLKYSDKVEAVFGRLRDVPGSGAAGGLGFALLALGAQLVPGAQVIEQHTGLREQMQDADWVITGEGRTDGQTLFGKLPFHVAQVARETGTEALLLSGSLGDNLEQLAPHFAGCFSIVEHPASLQECIDNADLYLYRTTRSLVRLIGKASNRAK